MVEQHRLVAQTESPSISHSTEHLSAMDPTQTPNSSTTSLIVPPSPPFTASSDRSLSSASSSQFQLPPPPPSDIQTNNGIEGLATINISSNQSLEVDPQILEALRNKDRIYVLKLGELMESLINDRR